MSLTGSADWESATLGVRAGQERTQEQEQAEPIFTTSSFTFRSAAEAAARFSGELDGNIYSRFTNPTVRTFERRLAALEGAEACVAFSSGMAAITAVFLALLETGDHVVAASEVFGSTTNLCSNVLPRLGIETDFVPLTDYEAWERAIGPRTRMLYMETPSNPLTEVGDIERLARIAHAHDCILVVDNCFCSPALQRPLALGADLVVHSATKFIDGQGRCVGGAVVGDAERVGQKIFAYLRTTGASMSPFNAWVFLKGLETLGLRMRAHCENAQAIAEWLQQQPQVKQVYYPGLESHPQHALARRQQSGFGGVVSFELDGGREAAWTLIDSLELISITANLGDAKTMITHPATTTHGRITPEQRAAAGIREGLVRLSVGLEDVNDLIGDLAQAFERLKN